MGTLSKLTSKLVQWTEPFVKFANLSQSLSLKTGIGFTWYFAVKLYLNTEEKLDKVTTFYVFFMIFCCLKLYYSLILCLNLY